MARSNRSSDPGRRLRVLFLLNAATPDEIPFTPGEAPDPFLLPKGLAALGIDVRYRRLYRAPANPLARRGTFLAGFDPLRALRVLLFDRRVDAVVSVGESNVALVLLLRRLLWFRPPVLLREINGRGWRQRDRVADYVVPRVDGTLLLTPHQMRWAPGVFRFRTPPDLVGFAVDEEFFRPMDRPDGGYILAVGDDGGRDYAGLIEACRGTPYRLVLRTDTNPVVPDDMRGQVTVLGRQSYLALRDLYACATLVAVPLLPVDHPSGITALFEGMATGRPVLATDVGSTRAIVRHGANGWLVPPGDVAGMRAAIVTLMGDAALRARLRAAARATIVAEASYGAYVARFADALRRAVARR